MTGKTVETTALKRSICVLLMFVCILFFILPHAHACGENDCPLCVLKNIISENLLTVFPFGVFSVLVCFVGNFTYFLEESAVLTLVHLKVKLSD